MHDGHFFSKENPHSEQNFEFSDNVAIPQFGHFIGNLKPQILHLISLSITPEAQFGQCIIFIPQSEQNLSSLVISEPQFMHIDCNFFHFYFLMYQIHILNRISLFYLFEYDN